MQEGRCLGCGVRGPEKGLGEAHRVGADGVHVSAGPGHVGRAPPEMGGAAARLLYRAQHPLPWYTRAEYNHTSFHMFTLHTQQTHPVHPGHTHARPALVHPCPQGPGGGRPGCCKHTGRPERQREGGQTGRQRQSERHRQGTKAGSGPGAPLRNSPFRLAQAMCTGIVPKPKAAGHGLYPQPGHLQLCDPGTAPLWASPACERDKCDKWMETPRL